MVTETLKIHNSHYTVNYQEGEAEKIHLIIKLVNENLKRISDNILEQKKQQDLKSDIDDSDDKSDVAPNDNVITTTIDLSTLLIMLVIEQQEKLTLFDSYVKDMGDRMKKVVSKLEAVKNLQ